MNSEPGHDRQLRDEVKWSAITITHSQVFPQFRVPSFLIGRLVHCLSANVEIHCLYGCVSVCDLCAFRHACLAPCTSACVQTIHMDNRVTCLSCLLVDWLTCPLTDLLYGDLHKWENRLVLEQLLQGSADFFYYHSSKYSLLVFFLTL